MGVMTSILTSTYLARIVIIDTKIDPIFSHLLTNRSSYLENHYYYYYYYHKC